jgi:hypothetical protein
MQEEAAEVTKAWGQGDARVAWRFGRCAGAV